MYRKRCRRAKFWDSPHASHSTKSPRWRCLWFEHTHYENIYIGGPNREPPPELSQLKRWFKLSTTAPARVKLL